MPNRAGDWLTQAQHDLDHARSARDEGRHEWACFASHQSAEKAVKAIHLAAGQEAWGQVVAKLLRELPDEPPGDLVEKAKVLDNHYIPTRYLNGHVEGAPFEHYGPIQSEEAIRHADEILAFARSQMA